MDEQEKSPSNDPVYRYENTQPKEFQPAFGDEQNIDAISHHIEKHIGKIDSVFHEIISDLVHIDIHWVKPNKSFPFHVLVTSGMSDKAMTVPPGLDEHKYAELCILLPSDWEINGDSKLMEEGFNDERNYWPLRWLKVIARFPHQYDTWLGWGHTIPNGENAEPFADNTEMGCMLMMPSINLPPDFFELKINENKTIKFFGLYTLYREEMELKMAKGTDAILAKFEKYNVDNIVNINRPNTCIKKGFLGLW